METSEIIGRKFGQLTVKESVVTSWGDGNRFRCECDCGKSVIIKRDYLIPPDRPTSKIWKRTSCGCSWRPNKTTPSLDKRIGQRFGKLVIVERLPFEDTAIALYLCKCDCGKEIKARIARLRSGKTSCGCDKDREAKHSRMYRGYEGISGQYFGRIRCAAKKRGIAFEISMKYIWDLFLEQKGHCAFSGVPLTISKSYGFTASLDRINSSEGYIEGNLQWVHKSLNLFKQNLTDQDFLFWCEKVTDYQRSLRS